MSHTTPKKAATAKPELMTKAFTTASALAMLWQKSSRELHLHELEWFADGAAQQVASDAHALASVVEGTACLVDSDDNAGSFQDSASVSSLLFNLQNQLNTIVGLADIAVDAGQLVRRALKGGAK